MNEERTVSEQLAEIIRKHYDLGTVETPERLKAAHQRRHRKLVVSTEKGRFLAKTYKRDAKTLDVLRFQHRLSAHLLENNLPVARIQEAINGKRIVEVDDWALELQEFIEGKPMQVDATTLVASAKALGRFHEVCRDFPRPERDARMWRFSEVPRDTFAKLYDRAREEDGSDRIDEHCNNIALFLRNASDELNWDARNRFETGLIHGDWHVGNLLFHKGKLNGIVDLEFSGDGCFLEDLSYAISNLCIRTTTDPIRLERRTDLLLDHYQRYRTLSPSEERALHYAVGIKHVTTVAYQSLQLDGTVAGFTPAQWMGRLDLQCKWLTHRTPNIRAI